MAKPPVRNVLLIIADQWRGDSLGCLGHPAALTRNLDALARDGVVFRNHFGQSAPCGPARASMLTGQYVMNHRVVANGIPLDLRHPNLAHCVRTVGIDPVLVGYTTTTPDPRRVPASDVGFTELGGVMDGFRVYAHLDEVEFRHFFGWMTGRGYKLPPRPADLWLPAEGPAGPTAGPSRMPADLSDTAWSAEHGLDFLRTTRADRPWMLHLGFFRPHPPFAAPAPYHEAVPEAAIPTPLRAATAEDEAAQHPMLAHWLRTQRRASYYESSDELVATLTDAEIQQTRRAYYGLIAEIDVWLGKIFETLRASGQWDNTLIIFTSDHGEQLGDHRLLGKLGWFDASYHLPLIIRDPFAAERGREVTAFTEAVDLMPTILDWLGADVPASCNGASLRPWLNGETPSVWRDAIHFEYDLRGGYPRLSALPDDVPPATGSLAAMRTARWKYVHLTGMPPVLYDLAADPGEMRNVAAEPAYQALLIEATQRMLSWRMMHADIGLTTQMASPKGLIPRKLAARE